MDSSRTSTDHGDHLLEPGASHLDLDAPLADFAANGFARLGVVLSGVGVEELRRRTDALMLGEISHDGLFFQHDSPTGRYDDLTYGQGWVGASLAYRKLEGLERDPLFRAWMENALFARIAHRVVGDAVSLYRAVVWNKAAHAGTELPWHQDDGKFWGIDRAPSLQIWTALDDAPEDAGCVEVLPGSHREGLASPEGGTVQAHRLTQGDAERGALKLAARAGEAILIHNHVWHRSRRNATACPRRAVSIAYIDAATRCLRRRRAPRQFQRLFV